MLIPGKPFKPNIMFKVRSGAYPIGKYLNASLVFREGTDLTCINYSMLERLVKDKLYSLFDLLVNFGRKKLYKIGLRSFSLTFVKEVYRTT